MNALMHSGGALYCTGCGRHAGTGKVRRQHLFFQAAHASLHHCVIQSAAEMCLLLQLSSWHTVISEPQQEASLTYDAAAA
jgi:hypothetical protein